MDFGFTAELALQYAVSTVLTALVSWVSVNFVNRVLETIDIENANRLRNLAERFHDLVTSRAFTMVVAEAMKLDADPESAREQLYNMRNVLVQRMRNFLATSDWGIMTDYAYTYLDSDEDYLLMLMDEAIDKFVARLAGK
jgi:hypothetical protein